MASMPSNGRPPLNSPGSILKELKHLDDKERLYQAKILGISAQRAELIRLLENSLGSLLTRSVHLDSEAAIPVTLSTQHGISAPIGDASEVNTEHLSPSQCSWFEARWDPALNEEEETLDSPINSARSPTPTQENWRSHVRQTTPSSFQAAKMSPVVEAACLEDADNAFSPEPGDNGTSHTCIGDTKSIFGSSDNGGKDLEQAVDFDSPEMSGWRIDPSQSTWGAAPDSSLDDGDEDVRNILSMDVNPTLGSNPPWHTSQTNFY